MSFFGFDTSHNKAAPGFSQSHDPFAALSNRNGNDADALDFDDTYDGLGDQLDETDDAFNDDTFGGDDVGASTTSGGAVGKDFDFFGQTAKVADAIDEEHLRYNRHQPVAKQAPQVPQVPQYEQPAFQHHPSQYYPPQYTSRPARSGYEKYKEPEPELQVDAALWGVAPKKAPAPAPAATPSSAHISAASRKIMSLEEVEAAMRNPPKKPTQPSVSTQPYPQQPFMGQPAGYGYGPPEQAHPQFAQSHQQPPQQPQPQQQQQQPIDNHLQRDFQGHGHPMTILQRPQSKHTPPVQHVPSPAAQQQQQQQHQQQPNQQRQQPVPVVQPTQILQNPNRLSGDAARMGLGGYPTQPTHKQQNSSISRQPQIITHPSQLAHLSEEEKSAYLEQEAKRAKRNHKIFLLSKDNGIMTPQDKNFITRIQLQQLVSATGNPNEHGTDESLNEDFYYQVHAQIRGSQRQHPNQPLNNFAQTYLFQTGSRQAGMRRNNRGPENHMQRMEQQVQRAVEAAKNKPKNKQLVIEGSLGKISFSNAKTPKPLLNIKRTESSGDTARPGTGHKGHGESHGLNRKSVLRDIEQVYNTLMKMEDHDRKMPPPLNNETDLDLMQQHVEWRDAAQQLNAQLWRELKVHEPIGATPVHPFIAFLSFPKGKKAVPRVFRHTTHEQRTTILTMIVVHLDQLDIVRGAPIDSGEMRLNAAMRENIELFQLAVMNTLFTFMNDLDLDIVTGVLGLISGLNVDLIAKTRIGASMLTMILSRAEIIKQAGGGNAQAWQAWETTYTNFFNTIEPTLPYIFPGSVNSGEDVYVWQLLAALGIGANQEQQQRLVLAVKDRVMDTVSLAKTLPADMSASRLQNVNLFMRSIGLDVELLQ